MPAPRRKLKLTELNMTPMIDCVFLLNTFFMIVLDFTRQDDIVDLKLPDIAAAIPDENPPPDRLVLSLMKNGAIYVSGREYNLNTPADAQKIKSFLWTEARLAQKTATGMSNRVVLVRGDRRTPFKYIRQIMVMCVDRNIQIWRLGFGTAPYDSVQEKIQKTGKLNPDE